MSAEAKQPSTYAPPPGALARVPKVQARSRPRPDEYLQASVQTATREQLMLMLVDGAIRAIDRAVNATDNAETTKLLQRAQDIVTELLTSLRPDMGEAYGNLVRLYEFVFTRLSQALTGSESTAAIEAGLTLRNLRAIWDEAIRAMNEQGRPPELTATSDFHLNAQA